MPVEITMPQLSDTMTEGTVVKWHKREGDKVKSGEELVDVETDKATMPFEASESGTLAHIAVKEGEKVPVGALIAVIATAKENAADVKKGAGGAKKAAPAPPPPQNAEQARGGAQPARAGSKAASAQDVSGSGRVPPAARDSGS